MTSRKDEKLGKDTIPPIEFKLDIEDLFENELLAEDLDPNEEVVSYFNANLDDTTFDSELIQGEKRISNTIYVGPREAVKEVSLQDFQVIKKIGEGAFAKVFLVKMIETESFFAMKVVRKDMLIEKDMLVETLLEKDILLDVDHPFLMSMNHVF